MTPEPIDTHPLPGDQPDDGTAWSLSYMAEQIEQMLGELPPAVELLNEGQREAHARLIAARAVLSGHAVLFGWTIAFRDDIGCCALLGETVNVGELSKGDRPRGHVVNNTNITGTTDSAPTACPDSSLLAWGLHEVDPEGRWEAEC